MNLPLIIGLLGPAGAGKTTLAHLLVTFSDIFSETQSLVRRPFAAAVRLEAAKLKTPSGARPDVWTKPTPPEVRELLQRIGAERRAEDPDYWIKRWNDDYGTTTMATGEGGGQQFEIVSIIDDVRFENEMDFVREKGGVNLFVEPAFPEYDPLTDETAYHESEWLASEFLRWGPGGPPSAPPVDGWVPNQGDPVDMLIVALAQINGH